MYAANTEQPHFATAQPPTPEQPQWQGEQGTHEMKRDVSASGAPMNAQEPLQPIPSMPPAQNPGPQTTTPSDNPAAAEDSDLIEKEWVLKAKTIVEKTRHDPYLENREISKLKADYMQKRYGKQLKVEE